MFAKAELVEVLEGRAPSSEPTERGEVLFNAMWNQPAGNRGVGLRRAHSLYGKVNAPDYLLQANEDTLIAVQAESTTAIENLEEIIAVPGIDAVFVGPFDLSVSLGIAGETSHPREIEAIEQIVEVCKAHNTIAGILIFDLDALKPWVEKGMRLIAYSSDISMLADAAAEAVATLKSLSK